MEHKVAVRDVILSIAVLLAAVASHIPLIIVCSEDRNTVIRTIRERTILSSVEVLAPAAPAASIVGRVVLVPGRPDEGPLPIDGLGTVGSVGFLSDRTRIFVDYVRARRGWREVWSETVTFRPETVRLGGWRAPAAMIATGDLDPERVVFGLDLLLDRGAPWAPAPDRQSGWQRGGRPFPDPVGPWARGDAERTLTRLPAHTAILVAGRVETADGRLGPFPVGRTGVPPAGAADVFAWRDYGDGLPGLIADATRRGERAMLRLGLATLPAVVVTDLLFMAGVRHRRFAARWGRTGAMAGTIAPALAAGLVCAAAILALAAGGIVSDGAAVFLVLLTHAVVLLVRLAYAVARDAMAAG